VLTILFANQSNIALPVETLFVSCSLFKSLIVVSSSKFINFLADSNKPFIGFSKLAVICGNSFTGVFFNI